MTSEEVRNALCLIGIVSVMGSAMYSLHRVTKRPEYADLMASGQRINLNLGSLITAYFRKSDDPLKPAHVKIAKIGILHFFAMLFGIVFVPIVIISTLLLLGVR